MKTSFLKAVTLFLGVAVATFFLLESLSEAQDSRSAAVTSSVGLETIEVPRELREHVKSSFEASEQLLGRERASLEVRLYKALRPEIMDLLSGWEAVPPRRASIHEKVMAELETSRIASSFDFLALVTQDNDVLLARDSDSDAAVVPLRVKAALIVAAEPFFRDAKDWSGFEALPTAVSAPLSKDRQAQGETSMYLISGLAHWVRPDAPFAVLVGGVSLDSFSRVVATTLSTPSGNMRWHAFLDDPQLGARVVAGSLPGARVSRAFFQSLLQEGSTEKPAFEGEKFAPGRWRAIYGRSDEILGGWGITVDPASLKRKLPAALPVPVDPFKPVLKHLEGNWPYYAAGVGGSLALFLVVLLVRMFRRDRELARARRTVQVDPAGSLITPAPMSLPASDSLVSQFELNWKTFASFTQDMLQKKLREIEDAPVRGVKDVREQVGKLNLALTELKADLAAARSEAKDTTVGVVEKVATIVAEESREQRSKMEDPSVLKKIEADFDRAASRFTQLDETVSQLAGFLGEKKKAEIEARVQEEVARLEGLWSAKVSEFGVELQQAKKQGQELLADLDKSRDVELLLRREVEQASARAEEMGQKLEERRIEVDAVAKDRDVAWRREREAQEALLVVRAREGALQAKCLELEASLERAHTAARDADLREEAALKDSRRVMVDLDRLRTELLQSQKEGQEAHSLLTRKEREHEEERAKLSERVKTLNSLVSQLNCQSNEMQAECDRLRSLVATKNDELALQFKTFEGLKEEKDRMDADRARLGAEVCQLEQDLKQDRHTLANTQQALEMHKIEVQDLTLKLSGAEKELELLQAAVHTERAEVRRIRAESELRERQIKPEMEAIEKALEVSLAETKRLRAGEEEISRLRSQLADAESRMRSHAEANESNARLQFIENERKDLLESIDRLGKELERVRTEADGIRCFQGTLVDGCIPAAIVAFDTSLKVFAWNSKAEGLWNKSPAAAIGRQLLELGLKGLEKDAGRFAESSLREKRSVSLPQSSFTDHKGKVRHVHFACDPIVGPRGEVLGGVLVAEEITDRVEHEIEARLQTLFSQSLAKSLPGALVVIDAQNRVISWNPSAESSLGVSESRALGENFFTLDTPLSKEAFRRHFEAVSKDRAPQRVRVRFEVGGVPTQFVVTQAPFLGSDDAIRGTILLLQEANETVEVAGRGSR